MVTKNFTFFWPKMSNYPVKSDDSMQEYVTFCAHSGFATRRAPRLLTRVLELMRPAFAGRSFFNVVVQLIPIRAAPMMCLQCKAPDDRLTPAQLKAGSAERPFASMRGRRRLCGSLNLPVSAAPVKARMFWTGYPCAAANWRAMPPPAVPCDPCYPAFSSTLRCQKQKHGATRLTSWPGLRIGRALYGPAAVAQW